MRVASLATDFVGESDVEADDEQIAADEGENCGKAHADHEKFVVLCPPEIDDDNSIV